MSKNAKKTKTVSATDDNASNARIVIDEIVHNDAPVLATEASVNEQIKSELEATDETQSIEAAATDQSTEMAAVEQEPEAVDMRIFDEIVHEIDDKEKQIFALKIGHSFDQREANEFKANSENKSIHKSLQKSRARLALPTPAAYMIAMNVDANFVNESIHTGAQYNIYAIEKIVDIVNAFGTGTVRNAINIAIMRSMFRVQAAGKVFTGELAKACTSKTYISKEEDREAVKLLQRHTISASVASTQASSTMRALTTLGIVKNVGSPKKPVYKLLNNPQTRKLQQIMDQQLEAA